MFQVRVALKTPSQVNVWSAPTSGREAHSQIEASLIKLKKRIKKKELLDD